MCLGSICTITLDISLGYDPGVDFADHEILYGYHRDTLPLAID